MSDKPYIRKIILTAVVMAIMLSLILIQSSPVYGWLNKNRYQQTSFSSLLILDTATGEVRSVVSVGGIELNSNGEEEPIEEE